ncbi:MAG: imidazoleglycerol-phosphate dehydratase HisB [Clostridiales bacterium]
MSRNSNIKRKTNETDIIIELEIDGEGKSKINTGIGFLDHMFELFSKHGLFDIELKAVGDLNVDCHHTVEDIGIVLGMAIKKALGEKISIKRYGTVFLPMDEALVMVSLDLSGRPYLVFSSDFNQNRVGDMDTQMVIEFFRAVSNSSGMNLHVKCLYGENTHHIIEAIFKAFAKSLREATRIDKDIKGIMSTKGSL